MVIGGARALEADEAGRTGSELGRGIPARSVGRHSGLKASAPRQSGGPTAKELRRGAGAATFGSSTAADDVWETG